MYIDIVDARNSNRFSVSSLFHYYGILHLHAKPFSLEPPMPYSQASDHSVTVDLTMTMLLIGTPLVDKRWRDLIHGWGYYKCHSWSRCSHHSFPLFSKWHSRFRKYPAGVMTCAA